MNLRYKTCTGRHSPQPSLFPSLHPSLPPSLHPSVLHQYPFVSVASFAASINADVHYKLAELQHLFHHVTRVTHA